MSIRSFLFLAVSLLLAADAVAAKEVKRVPAPEGVLPVLITESLGNTGSAYSDYDRLADALERVAKERKWPLKIAADRFAAGTADYLTELRISLQRVRQEIPGEYVYRAFTTLWIDGKEHNLDVISASYSYRMGENMDDVIDKVFRAGAKRTAEKIEPLLFPELNPKKK